MGQDSVGMISDLALEYGQLHQRLETAEAANCRMREGLKKIAAARPKTCATWEGALAQDTFDDAAEHGYNCAAQDAADTADAALTSTAPCPHEKELAEAKALLAECEGWLKEDSPGELIDKIEAFEKGGKR